MDKEIMKVKALDAYHLGVQDSDAVLAFDGLGALLGMTCEYEPHDADDNPMDSPITFDESEAKEFLASKDAFMRLAEGKLMGPEFAVFWETIAQQITD